MVKDTVEHFRGQTRSPSSAQSRDRRRVIAQNSFGAFRRWQQPALLKTQL
jgi:hypothetical protein